MTPSDTLSARPVKQAGPAHHRRTPSTAHRGEQPHAAVAAIKEHLAFTPAASISSSPIDLLPAHASVAYAQAGPQRGG
jgi:hypothetical protein